MVGRVGRRRLTANEVNPLNGFESSNLSPSTKYSRIKIEQIWNTMLYTNHQDLFYTVDQGVITVGINNMRGLHETPRTRVVEFRAWMAESLPHCTIRHETRFDNFFGHAIYDLVEVTRSELSLIKLAWEIKSRDEWIEEYHKRTQKILEQFRNDADRFLNTPLTRKNERAWVKHLDNIQWRQNV